MLKKSGIAVIISFLLIVACKEELSNPEDNFFALSGKIYEKDDQIDNIAGATIEVAGLYTISDVNGEYLIEKIPEGQHDVVFKKENFDTKTITLTFETDIDSLKTDMVRNSPAYFPLEPGYEWSYNAYDSVSNKSGTVNFLLVGRYLSEYPGKLSNFYISEDLDLFYDELFVFNNDTQIEFLGAQFDYPLTIGNKIGVDFYYTSVDGIEELAIGGTIYEAYRITLFKQNDEGYLRNTFWFVPHIGMVKMHFYYIDWGEVLDNYTLTIDWYRLR